MAGAPRWPRTRHSPSGSSRWSRAGYPRLRAFILTLCVFDDLIALIVIATAYSQDVSFSALAVAIVFFAGLLILRAAGIHNAPVSIALCLGSWVALYESGIHPTVLGLALGLSLSAYPPARTDLEQTTALAREFREQPTAELARETQRGITAAISPNERLQDRLHPWTSYLIVPLFALANAGTHISGDILRSAVTSPITLGIFFGYVVGKPVGILTCSWLATRKRFGLRLPVGWPNLFGGAAAAGIGFTVSLLVATLAFHGEQLTDAKLGILAAAIGATLISTTYFMAIKHLPQEVWARFALGRGYEEIVDLAMPVDPEEDHIRGPEDAPVTLVEYGDFECPYCGRAEPVLRELLADFGDELRFVFREPAARGRPPACAAGRRGGRGGRGTGEVLGDARQALRAPGRAGAVGPRPLRGGARPRRRPLPRRATAPRLRPRDLRGRRERRREQRRRDADVLHQRAAPPGLLRRGEPRAGGAHGLVAGAPCDLGLRTSRSFCASARARSFFSVWCSIWRMRSRVTLNARPTSSSVSGARPSSP